MSKRPANESSGSAVFALYDKLDRLEELIEDMAELGVTSIAEAEHQIEVINNQIDALETSES